MCHEMLSIFFEVPFLVLAEALMASFARKYFYKLMNLFRTWPTRQAIKASAEKFENVERSATISEPHARIEGHRAAEEYCCILWWDETIGRPDEPITVSSERVCQNIANENHANYRRPLIQGPCKPL
jgi:hypothetical protein